MIWFGVTPEGERLRLPAPVSARMNRAEDAPADGFEGVFPMERSRRVFTALLGYGAGGALVFDGIVDEQRETCGTVAELFLAARSRAALLLDNEAVPQVYSAPSLPVLFARHAAPYGFSGFAGPGRAFPGELTVERGMSEWQVLEMFCTRFLKIRPRAESGVFDASGVRPAGGLLFSNRDGTAYSSVRRDRNYYALISELRVQADAAAFPAVFRDETAAALGIRRGRLLSADKNVEQTFAAARKKFVSFTVTCPGEVDARLFMQASVSDPVLGREEGLAVSEIDYALTPDGETTRFLLRRDGP